MDDNGPTSELFVSDEPAAQLASSEELAVELAVVTGRFSRAVTQLAQATISRAMWRMLAQLEERGALRISQLAALDRIAQPTATTLVQRLVRDGYVQTAPDPADARATLVSLAPGGERLLRQLRAEIGARLAPRLTTLSQADQATLRRAMAILRTLP